MTESTPDFFWRRLKLALRGDAEGERASTRRDNRQRWSLPLSRMGTRTAALHAYFYLRPCPAWSNTRLQSRGSHYYCRSCHHCRWQHYYYRRSLSSSFLNAGSSTHNLNCAQKLTKFSFGYHFIIHCVLSYFFICNSSRKKNYDSYFMIIKQ